jgi:hypothetical protein
MRASSRGLVSRAGPSRKRIGMAETLRRAVQTQAIPGGVCAITVETLGRSRRKLPIPRSEWYWDLRERFERGDIDIDPNDDQLAKQLGEIKRKLLIEGPDRRGVQNANTATYIRHERE